MRASLLMYADLLMLSKVIPAYPEKEDKVTNHERSLFEEFFDLYK